MTKSLYPWSFAYGGHSGLIDSIEGEPLPLVRVIGWHDGPDVPPMTLRLDNRELQPLSVARQRRPDVLAAKAARHLFSGFRVDFLFSAGERPVSLQLGDGILQISDGAAYGCVDPHYGALFTETRVLGRASIYGSGPPVDVSLEFKEFIASATQGRTLDFGCGNGDLVVWLRGRGIDAEGLELDEPRIRDALHGRAAGHVKFYDGSIPIPFDDASFDTITSTEVIEHVPHVERYVAELARVLRPGGRMVLTTPDITSVPSTYPAGCVPWHLLESTHINFFTPASVATLFSTHFEIEEFYCLGAGRVNGLFMPGSIGAVLRRTAHGIA